VAGLAVDCGADGDRGRICAERSRVKTGNR
jgi:hypothetical protein